MMKPVSSGTGLPARWGHIQPGDQCVTRAIFS